MNKYISYLLLFTCLIIFNNLQAQDSLNQATELEILEEENQYVPTKTLKLYNAYNSGLELQNGILIVLLRSESKRLSQLETLSRSSEYSEKEKQYILEKIGFIKEEADFVNQALIDGFNEKYKFSEVYFAYDTSLTSIQKGIKKGIFVADYPVIDKTITMEEKTIFLCRYGLVSKSQSKDGLTLMNVNGQKIKNPFPTVSVAGSSGALLILNLFTNDEIYAKRSIAKDIQKLERRLFDLIKRGKSNFDEE